MDTIYIKSGDKDERLKYIISIAKNKKILIKEVDRKKLDTLAQGENHQGVAASVSEYEYYDFEKLLDDIKVNKEQSKKNFVMILDKIEDPHNLGAIIRSAHLSGVDAIIIPNRRSANVDSTVEKVSVGATSYMKISRVTNLNDTIEKLKKVGLWIYCLDMGNDYYFNTDLTGDIAVVVGNEGKGVSELIRKNIEELYDEDICDRVTIQYGGSVKPENATEIMNMDEIDGALVGGASLVPEKFMGIINF